MTRYFPTRYFPVLALVLCIIVAPAPAEDETRDFYAEPGMNPFKTEAGQDVTENIDPFSGNLHLSYVDLLVPGNGGLDIAIHRHYNLPQSSPGYANPFGYGWTMHFGRITIGSGHASQLCGGPLSADSDTQDNPSIEMPDGGRELLVHSSALNDGTYITKSNWKAECIDPGDYTRGIVATAPNGTAYYMREYVFMQGEDGPAGEPAPAVETWLTNQIVDVHGNSIDISYMAIASGMKLVSRITSSDGRDVSFEYLKPDGGQVTSGSMNARLTSITANSQTWRYEYVSVEGSRAGWGLVHHHKLTSVLRPDGTRWNYQYGTTATEAEYNRLTRVTYPAGGAIDYSYQWIRPYLPNAEFRIVAIKQKTQDNPGHDTGTWTYEFNPGYTDFADLGIQPLPDNAGRLADFTRIVTPVGEEHIYHVGYWALVGTHDILWQMGLKLIHRYFEPASGGGLRLVRGIGNSWDKRSISAEIYRGGVLSALWDQGVDAPVLTRRSVQLDAYTYATDYSNYDAFGNPGNTTEWAIYPSEGGNRITEVSYHNDTASWIIGLPETETVSQDGGTTVTTVRSFSSKGQLLSENRFGVTTSHTYTQDGDLASTTDANGNVTRYSDYHRGQHRREDRPDATHTTRAINDTGTVAAKTSARGFTTYFSYDDLNRLTGIDYPQGADVAISWNSDGKSLTRGDYREDVNWDGYGREVELIRRDLGTGDNYIRQYRYDALGRRFFESDINSSNGVSREFDAADRPTRITYQDGSYRTITHEGAHKEVHRDENGNLTDYLYQVYGAPENRFLSWVISPESVATHIGRDAFGNIRSVFQGGTNPADPSQYLGYTQTYSYNSRLQLTGIDSPADIGLTSYGRDAAGNMTSKRVGLGSTVSFSYDSMNRLLVTDYADDTIDVAYQYDADGNPIEISNSFATRRYSYDANGNLSAEQIDIGDNSYAVQYGINELDHIASIEYPSGRRIDYAPDALGRPTAALPYLTDVSHFPNGTPQQQRYANGLVTDYAVTARQWIDQIDMSGISSQDYSYDAAGNLIAIADALDPGYNRSMAYDGLHRLVSAQGLWGSANYAYDAYSNLIEKSDPARANRSQHYQYRGLNIDRIVYSSSTAQRIFSLDSAGNISYSDDAIFDPLSGLPTEVLTRREQVFDDAGNMTYASRATEDNFGGAVPLLSGNFSSEYDGANLRVRKVNHSQGNRSTDYLYSRSGLLLGEYEATGTRYGHEYFYLGTQQVASAKHNAPPAVATVDDLSATGGTEVSISASSSDSDGDIVSVTWTQTAGPTVTITNPDTAETSFVAPRAEQEETVTLLFTAIDNHGGETSDTLTIVIEPSRLPADISRLAVIAGNESVLVRWDQADGAENYTLHWTNDPGLPLEQWQQVITSNQSFLHEGLANGAEYHYALAATNSYGSSEVSATVSAIPGAADWQAPVRIPDNSATLPPQTTHVVTNGLGDSVLVYEETEATSYRLYGKRYDLFYGWSEAFLLDESQYPHYFTLLDLDDNANALAVWASGAPEARNLYAAFWPQGNVPEARQLVEHYSGEQNANGDVVGISHLEFTDSGEAFLCWRQNRLHAHNNYYDPDGASALAKRFSPGQGWIAEHNLEVSNNMGDTRNLSCDVSANGHLLAAWERYNDYDPEPFTLNGKDYDVWVSAYDPSAGWEQSETVEFLATGLRENNGRGIHNRSPRVAVSASGQGAVVWYNETDNNIESIEYRYGESAWTDQLTLESRSNRIPAGNTHRIAANRTGDFTITWGDRYITRPANSANWDRSRSLPGTPLHLGVDIRGNPFTVHASGNDLVINRLLSGSWYTHTLNDPGDSGAKLIKETAVIDTNTIVAHWTSGNSLYLSTNQQPAVNLPDPDAEDTTPPITSFSTSVSRSKGSTQHMISLSANETSTTFFRFAGQGSITDGGTDTADWQDYGGPVTIELSKKGSGSFDFYSVDAAGNVEMTRTEELQ